VSLTLTTAEPRNGRNVCRGIMKCLTASSEGRLQVYGYVHFLSAASCRRLSALLAESPKAFLAG